jgi:hypothetical protein
VPLQGLDQRQPRTSRPNPDAAGLRRTTSARGDGELAGSCIADRYRRDMSGNRARSPSNSGARPSKIAHRLPRCDTQRRAGRDSGAWSGERAARRRGAVFHEPALFSLFDEPKGVRETLVQLIKDAMEAGGPAAAFERFIRFGAGESRPFRGARADRQAVPSPHQCMTHRRGARGTFGASRRLPTVMRDDRRGQTAAATARIRAACRVGACCAGSARRSRVLKRNPGSG